jgi:hypothetical protein
LKNYYFSSHKLSKQQSTSFWSQGILGIKHWAIVPPLYIALYKVLLIKYSKNELNTRFQQKFATDS